MFVSALTFMALVLLAIRGLHIGKWLHKAGGALMLGTFAMLLLVPWLNVATGALPSFRPLSCSSA